MSRLDKYVLTLPGTRASWADSSRARELRDFAGRQGDLFAQETAGIGGQLACLEDDLEDGKIDDAKSSVKGLQRMFGDLGTSIHYIFKIIAEGLAPRKLEPVDLLKFLATKRSEYEAKYGIKGLVVNLDTSGLESVRITTDPRIISGILDRLVENAAIERNYDNEDFLEAGDSIDIKLSEAKGGDFYKLSVENKFNPDEYGKDAEEEEDIDPFAIGTSGRDRDGFGLPQANLLASQLKEKILVSQKLKSRGDSEDKIYFEVQLKDLTDEV